MNRRRYWLSIVFASLLSIVLMFSAVSYASAASVKSTGPQTVTGTLNPTDFYLVGYNDGLADGMLQCSQGATIPVVWRRDPRLNYNLGYNNGLIDGFRQQGCSI